MKFFHVFLSGMIVLSQNIGLFADTSDHHGVYYAELEAIKNAPETKLMFDEDAHGGLSAIQRDIITYKNLTHFQRSVRSIFLLLDVVMVTPETMPLLYEYVDGICKKASIATPSVFITRQDGFFNAFAQKLLMSTGGIVIGQKLMKELSDDALEAVVAHEIGHIKHNHINKMLCLRVINVILLHMLAEKSVTLCGMMPRDNAPVLEWCGKLWLMINALECFESLIINKRFEKEADRFAYEANGKGKGIIEFFELILKKDQLREEEFAPIYDLLQKNRANLSTMDYYGLAARYYLARAGQSYTNFYKKIYHETFVGAHPSPQARIDAAQEYLAKQQS